MSGDEVGKAYAGIMADIATRARKLAAKPPYKSASGSEALMAFADHLEGIVGAIGVDQSRTVRVPVRNKRTRQKP